MKQPQTSKWPQDIEPIMGMLLFAQLWDEMLFDYALDSYQPRRFNILGLCSELIDAYEYFENDLLSAHSLTPITEELLDALNGDKIAKGILGTELPIIKGVLLRWNSSKPGKQISYAADTMLNTVEPLMQARLVENLQLTIVDPKNKDDISDLSRRLLTEVLRKGYSPNFIYHAIQNRLFGNTAVNGIQDLPAFLKLFEGTDKKYEVVFKMGHEGKLIARNAKENFIQFADTREALVAG